MTKENHSATNLKNLARIILGLFMILAGLGHLSFQREEFQAQVPNWIPMNQDLVVLLSGIVEILLGVAMIFWRKQRIKVGIALAIFYILVFPGNIAQYTEHRNAFGLDTDTKRLARLFFQPVLIIWTLWSSGVLKRQTAPEREN
ncbi:DoxX family protein [Pedobacter panaciterrae]|uniref:DoxX family protein n=1 Tax=Pedobacter panaciterrae TaxID=363849 RepID=UPI002598A44D|nr:DoxX family membrane protein [uncultured Pedobacter sp.]